VRQDGLAVLAEKDDLRLDGVRLARQAVEVDPEEPGLFRVVTLDHPEEVHRVEADADRLKQKKVKLMFFLFYLFCMNFLRRHI
jgi:hypothetical protein